MGASAMTRGRLYLPVGGATAAAQPERPVTCQQCAVHRANAQGGEAETLSATHTEFNLPCCGIWYTT